MNGGNRTIVVRMEEGTVAAIRGGIPVIDHRIKVIDDIGERNDFISIDNIFDGENGMDQWGIVGSTKVGNTIIPKS